MIYTTKENQSFDAEILRQELVAALGRGDWYIETGGNEVKFVGENFDPTAAILAHFANSAKRDHNKAIDSDIQDMEVMTPITHRTLREFMLGAQKLIAQSIGISETSMLDPQSPNYSHAYAKFKAFNDATVTKRQGRVNP